MKKLSKNKIYYIKINLSFYKYKYNFQNNIINCYQNI